MNDTERLNYLEAMLTERRIGESLLLTASTSNDLDCISAQAMDFKDGNECRKDLLLKHRPANIREFIDLMANTTEADDGKWYKLEDY